MVETAKFEVIQKNGEFEIRKYNKLILVKVDTQIDNPFNILFQYISGANKSRTKISMTSPVITSEKIAMTSPVISSSESMSFVVPSEYDLQTVPEPTDERVSINEIPERYIATIRFRGFARKNTVEKQKTKLLRWSSDEKIDIIGSTFLMQYNPPFVLGFLRRNEIGVEVKYEA
jgi:SOUL heme-binding protein